MILSRFELCFLLLISFCCTVGLFVRDSIFGFDGYASVACIRHGFCDTLGWQEGALFLFEFFPDSLFFFKMVMFVSLFLTVVPIYLFVKEKYSRHWGYVSVFTILSLSPMMLFEFGKFENELFAFPLMAWGIYFLLNKKFVKSGFLFFSSLWFWIWPGYFLQNHILSPGPTIEQLRFAGVINLWFLLPVVFFIPLLKSRWEKVLGLVFVVFFLWNTKLFLFLFFFLAYVLPFAYREVRDMGLFERLSFIDKKTILLFVFFCCIGINIAFLMQQPTPNQLYMVDRAIELSEEEDFNLYNDWYYGYWMWAEGFKTKNHPGSGAQINFHEIKEEEIHSPFLVLTNEDMSEYTCEILNQPNYFGRKINVWKCT